MKSAGSVVIVGRMNVGKSTLFNRLSSDVKSIALDYAGVTRDVIKDVITWQDKTFELIDTGGISFRKSQDPLMEQVRLKAVATVENAAVILFVVDGAAGILDEDREIVKMLRKTGRSIVLVINKTDSKYFAERAYEFEKLGLPSVEISAEHARGLNDLLDAVVAHLPQSSAVLKEEPACKIVFLGRPNVGKSSLMNALLEEERSIVSDIPGTTREAVSERIMFYKENLQITDTPGIRRKRAIEGNLEPLMVKSAFGAMKNADVVVMLLDIDQDHLVDQELKLAFYAFTEHYKSMVFVINKIDLKSEQDEQELERRFDLYKYFIKKIPVLSISCKTGKNVGKVLPLVKKVHERSQQRFEDIELKHLFISELTKRPLMHNKQFLEVYKVKQVSAYPLTIGLQVNVPDWFGPSQLSFFENLMREKYDLVGVPVKFIVRKRLV